ncbi:hypothetical protein [Proteus mirabilis]|uniref:hypothetical protein n=1 Tax=Proteus mirabilis TaxID=584 RepID=UPI0018C68060|nr:hypothetical protein [Proteus mirabilis]MBG6041765.1 hypothetical protein [Proteus mirabilis]HEI8294959.1 hypothetical protein [Proteus mirabilis]
MDIKKENKRLSQVQHIDKFKTKYKVSDMVTVYLSETNKLYDRGIYSVLVPFDRSKKVLSRFYWSYQGGEGRPDTETLLLNKQSIF